MNEDLLWLVNNCVSVSLECNVHRGYHETASQSFAESSDSCSPEVRAQCERLDTILCLHVYPDNSVGFYVLTHYDLDELCGVMRRTIEEERAKR